MERLTTDKDVSEMNMTELAYNSCYAKDGFARCRDFDTDIDARDLARFLIKHYTGEDAPKDDEEFDEYMLDNLQYSVFSTGGLLATFYRNLWAMAELRENLKEYEDAEENGLLVRLPCKVGDCLYSIALGKVAKHKVYGCRYNGNDVFLLWVPGEFRVDGIPAKSIGKTVFLTQEEAEAKLKEMEGENGDSD